jgi:hypothetical protein
MTVLLPIGGLDAKREFAIGPPQLSKISRWHPVAPPKEIRDGQSETLGLPAEVVQDNHSRSVQGVTRDRGVLPFGASKYAANMLTIVVQS